MDAKTLKALNGSINKWQKIVDGTGVDNGPDNCPLCQLFLYLPETCAGCPVAAKVGTGYCSNTPYEDEWLVNCLSDPATTARYAHRGLAPESYDDAKFTNDKRLIWINPDEGLHVGHMNVILQRWGLPQMIVL